MKKLNFAIFGALMLTCLTTRALAETTIPWTKEGCESVKGTWVTAHSPTDDGCDAAHCNGMNFCKSSAPTNLWSALVWCKSIGHKLADFTSLCPGLPPTESSQCQNMRGITGDSWAWTTMPGGTYRLIVNTSSGRILGRVHPGNLDSQFPMCEE